MRKVLVVDDDPAVLRVLASVLDLEGLAVTTASDGTAALAAAREDRPDVVICDVAMPGVSGLQVCRTLRSDPSTSDVPVVLLTARGSRRDRELGVAAGCDAYLVKPFDPIELIEVARTVERAEPDAAP